MKTNEAPKRSRPELKISSEQQKAWELKMVPLGYKKVRSYLVENKWAVRYLPANYQLRVDEEVCE